MLVRMLLSRYTLTVYPVVIFAMCSIITKVSSIGGINLVLASLLLAISAILFCIRISLVVLVSCKSYMRGSEVATLDQTHLIIFLT